MRQLRLLFLLALFTFVTWADEHSRGGILYSEWELRQITSPYRAARPYTLASLDMEPAAARSDSPAPKADDGVRIQWEVLSEIEGSANSASEEAEAAFESSDRNAASPVPIGAMCVAMTSAAIASELPVGFFARLIWQESKFGQWVVSKAGAMGVAQFMPRTAAWIGLSDPFDPISALPASARFLNMLREQFGNLGLAAAAYNAGPGRIQNWLAGRSALPEETRNYVRIITGHDVEKWTQPRQIEVSFHLPKRAPCVGMAGLSHEVDPRKVDVRIEPAIAKLIKAKAEAAAKAAARQAARKAAKLASNAKAGRVANKKVAGKAAQKALASNKSGGGKVAAKHDTGSSPRTETRKVVAEKRKTVSGKPMNIATN
jgi:plasmid stabilization system protein ParE